MYKYKTGFISNREKDGVNYENFVAVLENEKGYVTTVSLRQVPLELFEENDKVFVACANFGGNWYPFTIIRA